MPERTRNDEKYDVIILRGVTGAVTSIGAFRIVLSCRGSHGRINNTLLLVSSVVITRRDVTLRAGDPAAASAAETDDSNNNHGGHENEDNDAMKIVVKVRESNEDDRVSCLELRIDENSVMEKVLIMRNTSAIMFMLLSLLVLMR